MVASVRTGTGTVGVGNAPSGTTLSVALPSAVATGDLVLAVVYMRQGTAAYATPPSGWTLLAQSASTSVGWQGVYFRVRQAGDPTSISFVGTSGRHAGVTIIVDGANVSDLLDVVGTVATLSGASSSAAALTVPGVTTTKVAPLVLAVVAGNTTGGTQTQWTGPSGMPVVAGTTTVSGGTTSDSNVAVGAQQQSSAGATGTKVFTPTAPTTTASGQGWLLALNSAAAPAVAPTVSAGADQTVDPFVTVTVQATVDKGTVTWAQVGGPTVTVTPGMNRTATIIAPATMDGATITLRATATDSGLTATDDVVITVRPHNEWARIGTSWLPVQARAL